jgi:hypothetical protein
MGYGLWIVGGTPRLGSSASILVDVGQIVRNLLMLIGLKLGAALFRSVSPMLLDKCFSRESWQRGKQYCPSTSTAARSRGFGSVTPESDFPTGSGSTSP